ncbi:MAG: hypothetical protein ACRCSL_12850, partial [Microbacterium sp.]
RWYVPVSAALAMLMLPAVIQLQTYLATGGDQYFTLISIRYSMPTLPLLLASAAFIVEKQSWVHSTWGVVGAWLVVAFATIAFG